MVGCVGVRWALYRARRRIRSAAGTECVFACRRVQRRRPGAGHEPRGNGPRSVFQVKARVPLPVCASVCARVCVDCASPSRASGRRHHGGGGLGAGLLRPRRTLPPDHHGHEERDAAVGGFRRQGNQAAHVPQGDATGHRRLPGRLPKDRRCRNQRQRCHQRNWNRADQGMSPAQSCGSAHEGVLLCNNGLSCDTSTREIRGLEEDCNKFRQRSCQRIQKSKSRVKEKINRYSQITKES